uniref:Uncharacterized protein n=1 Tax=Bionectria ochroleuca TaxID=29856 RepID=A0A8H7N5W7_BIOOC
MSIPDEEWRVLSQQVTPSADIFIQSILEQRNSLVAEEKTQRTGASFKSSLSKTAQEACAIVDRTRRHKQENVWVH